MFMRLFMDELLAIMLLIFTTGTLKEPFFPGSLKKAVHDDPYLTLGTACNWPDLLIGRVDL